MSSPPPKHSLSSPSTSQLYVPMLPTPSSSSNQRPLDATSRFVKKVENLPSPSASVSITKERQNSTSLLPPPPQNSGSTPTKRRSKVPNNDRRNTDIEFATEIGQGLLLEVRKMQAMLQEKEEKLRLLQIQKADLERAAEAMAKQLRQREENEERLKEETWSLELAKQELTTSVTELQQNLTKANTEYKKVARLVSSLERDIETLRDKEEKLSTTIEAMKARHEQDMSSVRRQTAALQRDKQDQTKQIEALTSELAIAKAQFRMGKHGLSENEQSLSAIESEHANKDSLNTQTKASSGLSPPSSPTLKPSRNQALEVETLKTSLAHAHRMVSNLRSNYHKEKTEKFELKKLLAESQETIEQLQNDPRMWEDANSRLGSGKKLDDVPPSPRRATGKKRRMLHRPRPVGRHSHLEGLTKGSGRSLLPGNDDTDAYSYSSMSSEETESESEIEPMRSPGLPTMAGVGFTSLSSELSQSQRKRPVVIDMGIMTEPVLIIEINPNETMEDAAKRLNIGGIAGQMGQQEPGIEIHTQTDSVSTTAALVQTEGPSTVETFSQTDVISTAIAHVQTESTSTAAVHVQTENINAVTAHVQTEPASGDDAVVQTESLNPEEAFVQTESVSTEIAFVQTEEPSTGIASVQTEYDVGVEIVTQTEHVHTEEALVQTQHDAGFEMDTQTDNVSCEAAYVQTENDTGVEILTQTEHVHTEDVFIQTQQDVNNDDFSTLTENISKEAVREQTMCDAGVETSIQTERVCAEEAYVQTQRNASVEMDIQTEEISTVAAHAQTEHEAGVEIVTQTEHVLTDEALVQTEQDAGIEIETQTKHVLTDEALVQTEQDAGIETETQTKHVFTDEALVQTEQDVGIEIETQTMHVFTDEALVQTEPDAGIEMETQTNKVNIQVALVQTDTPLYEMNSLSHIDIPPMEGQDKEVQHALAKTTDQSVQSEMADYMDSEMQCDEVLRPSVVDASTEYDIGEETAGYFDGKHTPEPMVFTGMTAQHSPKSTLFTDMAVQHSPKPIAGNNAEIQHSPQPGQEVEMQASPALVPQKDVTIKSTSLYSLSGDAPPRPVRARDRPIVGSMAAKQETETETETEKESKKKSENETEQEAEKEKEMDLSGEELYKRYLADTAATQTLLEKQPSKDSMVPPRPERGPPAELLSRAGFHSASRLADMGSSVTSRTRSSDEAYDAGLVQSPESMTGSVSSLSTMNTNDQRLSVSSSHFNSSVKSLQSNADLNTISVITKVMIGDWMYKYTRKVVGGAISENRHMRYFWIHPYTRTLYWSSNAPGVDGSESKAKSAFIESVSTIPENNSQGADTSKSLLIQASGRQIKVTAPSVGQRDMWLESISYLLNRSGADNATTTTAPSIGRKPNVQQIQELLRTQPQPQRTYSTPMGSFVSKAPSRRQLPIDLDDDDDEEELPLEDVRMCCNGKHHVSKLEKDHTHKHHHRRTFRSFKSRS